MDSSEDELYDSLDDVLDAYPLGQYIQSQNKPDKRQRVGYSQRDMRPLAFIRLNTSLGKPKPVTVHTLLNSGASESLVTKKFVTKLQVKDSEKPATVWATPAGELKTSAKVKAQFTP